MFFLLFCQLPFILNLCQLFHYLSMALKLSTNSLLSTLAVDKFSEGTASDCNRARFGFADVKSVAQKCLEHNLELRVSLMPHATSHLPLIYSSRGGENIETVLFQLLLHTEHELPGIITVFL